MFCIFVINGERQVTGDIWFQPNDGVELVFQVGCELPLGPITLPISLCDCYDVADFFAKDYIYFWKVLVLVPSEPYRDVMCIVSFSKDDNGVAIHLSLDFGAEKMHIETPIDACTLKAMSSVWAVS